MNFLKNEIEEAKEDLSNLHDEVDEIKSDLKDHLDLCLKVNYSRGFLRGLKVAESRYTEEMENSSSYKLGREISKEEIDRLFKENLNLKEWKINQENLISKIKENLKQRISSNKMRSEWQERHMESPVAQQIIDMAEQRIADYEESLEFIKQLQSQQVKPLTAVLGENKSENGDEGNETSASLNRNPETADNNQEDKFEGKI